MTELTGLENAVLEALLTGEDEELAVLRKQANKAKVSSREMTGVGFFTQFFLPPDVERLANSSTFKLGDVNGIAENVRHGLGFVLYIENGIISALEGYTYDEPWPKEVRGLMLSYSGGKARDLTQVRRILH